MAINKVEFYGETLMDISDTTVTSESIQLGKVAYDAQGNKIVGEFDSYSKEESDSKYATKDDIQSFGNVKTINNQSPDEIGNININIGGSLQYDEENHRFIWNAE